MRDYLTIGATPCNETCVGVGNPLAKRECRAFINQIRRALGPEPVGAALRIKGFDHDFGTYYEVVCYFEQNGNEYSESAAYAFRCESESPTDWDEEARKELQCSVS